LKGRTGVNYHEIPIYNRYSFEAYGPSTILEIID